MIGMAHRGRLNVLVNVLGKMPKDLFLEFEGKSPLELPSGDVKYHNGYSSDISTAGGPMHLSLAFNPSHLEIVNPVVEGSVRARQRRRDDKTGDQVLPILVHGDAAFAGQGVVMETLNLSGTRGYGTGGTVHLIVNNQIGFTTSDPRDTRSTIYCTDVAKMVEAPIFHVERRRPRGGAVRDRLAPRLSSDLPQGRGGRHRVLPQARPQRAGRAGGDAPLMYKKIAQRPGTSSTPTSSSPRGVVKESEPEEMIKTYRATLDAGQQTVSPVLSNFKSKFAVVGAPFWRGSGPDAAPTTHVPLEQLKRLSERGTWVPEDFRPHRSSRAWSRRASRWPRESCRWTGDWRDVAYASLLSNGYDVRFSGRTRRAAPSFHRHAVR